MQSWFDNKNIAVVGNASSLLKKNYGKEIDSHEVVVRINRGILCSNSHSQGEKINVWVFNLYNRQMSIFHSGIKNSIRKSYYTMQMNEEFDNANFDYSYPMAYYTELKSKIGMKQPTTGLRILDYISKCNPKHVDVYGFDWKETPTFYDRFANDSAHNYTKEKQYCAENFFNTNLFTLR